MNIEQILKTFPDALIVDDFLQQVLNKVTYDEFISEIIHRPNIYTRMSEKQDFWRNFIMKTFAYNKPVINEPQYMESEENDILATNQPITFVKDEDLDWFNEFLRYAEPVKRFYLASTTPSALTGLIHDFVFTSSVVYIDTRNQLPINDIVDVKITARNFIPEYYILKSNGDVLRVYQVNYNQAEQVPNDINHDNNVDFQSKIEKFATNVKNIEIILYDDETDNSVKYYIFVLLLNDGKIQYMFDVHSDQTINETFIQHDISQYSQDELLRIKRSHPPMPDINYDSIQLVCGFISNIYDNYPNERYFSARSGNQIYLLNYSGMAPYFTYKRMIYHGEEEIINYSIIKPEKNSNEIIIFIVDKRGRLSAYRKLFRDDTNMEQIQLNSLFTDNVIPVYLTKDLQSIEAFREEFSKDIFVVFKTNKRRAFLYLLKNNILYSKNDPDIAAVEFFIPRNKTVLSIVSFDSYGRIYYVQGASTVDNNVKYDIMVFTFNMFNRAIMPKERYHYGIIYERNVGGDKVIYPYAMYLLQMINNQTYNETSDKQFIYFKLRGSPYEYYSIREY